jgi:hypothetical protein
MGQWVGAGGTTVAADVEWECDLGHVPLTLGCVIATIGGPCGTCAGFWQSPTLVCTSAGEPSIVTRIAGTIHCTVRQGDGAGGGI